MRLNQTARARVPIPSERIAPQSKALLRQLRAGTGPWESRSGGREDRHLSPQACGIVRGSKAPLQAIARRSRALVNVGPGGGRTDICCRRHAALFEGSKAPPPDNRLPERGLGPSRSGGREDRLLLMRSLWALKPPFFGTEDTEAGAGAKPIRCAVGSVFIAPH